MSRNTFLKIIMIPFVLINIMIIKETTVSANINNQEIVNEHGALLSQLADDDSNAFVSNNVQNGFINNNSQVYYYNNQGQMIYGEQKIDNNWYYFDKVTGAISDDSTIVPKNAKEAGINGYNNGGWGYYSHNCTAFVAGVLSAQGVPDSVIRGLGNGSEWASCARNKGLRVDLIPEPGTAISFKGGTSLYPYAEGHVAYVTSINNDGTFNIIEGNYSGLAYHERIIRVDSTVAGIIHF